MQKLLYWVLQPLRRTDSSLMEQPAHHRKTHESYIEASQML